MMCQPIKNGLIFQLVQGSFFIKENLMNIRHAFLVLTLSFAICSCTYAIEGDYFIGGGLGLSMPWGDLANKVDLGLNSHLFGQYQFSDRYGVRASMEYRYLSGQETIWFNYDTDRLTSNLGIFDIICDGTADFEVYDEMFVSGLAGLGLYFWSVDTSSNVPAINFSNQGTSIGFNFGGSYRYQFAENMSIQATLLQHLVDFTKWTGLVTWTDINFSFVYRI
jgi:hypothetical protein